MNVGSVVMIYAAFAAAWILFSDKVVEWFFSDPAELTTASIFKGWLFVAVTSILLYRLLRPKPEPGVPSEPAIPVRSRWGLPFALLALVILAIAVASTVQTAVHYQEKEAARLDAIVEFKARQFTDWLVERQADADFVRSSVYYADPYRQWRQGGDAAAGQRLQARLESFRGNRRFSGVTVIDPDGKTLWSSFGADPQMAPILRAAVEVAVRERKVERAGPYLDPAGRPQLDYVAPLGIGDPPVPVVVLHTDPVNWLYPTLQSWPVPSKTGESYLFRRDGHQVLYLSELRHRADAALKLRLPIATPELLVARVLRGEHREDEMGDARDYRDVPVLGMVRGIPGTDWYLAAEVDRTEVLGEVLREATWIGITSLLALFMAAAGFYLLRQRTQLAYAENIRTSQAERLRAQQLLAAIADSSDDGIFALDREGRFVLFNRAAERMTGRNEREVLGRNETFLFPPELAQRQVADNRRVMESGVGMVVEETLPTAVGNRIYLVAKNPLRDENGMTIGLCGIIRDITERKLAADLEFRTLRRQTDQWRALDAISASPALLDGDVERLAREITEEACRVAGVARANAWLFDEAETELRCIDLYEATAARHSAGAILKQAQFENEFRALKSAPYVNADDPLTDPRTAGYVESYLKPLGITSMLDAVIEYSGRHLGLLCFEHVGKPHHWEPDEISFACRLADKIALAITSRERRRTLEKLRESEARFRTIIERSPVPFALNDAEQNITYLNEAFTRTFGYDLADIPSLTAWWPLAYPDPAYRQSVVEAWQARLDQVRRNNAPFEPMEVEIHCKDGAVRTAVVGAVSLAGAFEGDHLVSLFDITERNRAVQALRESEARFRALYENAAISIIVHDRDTGAIVQANRKAIESYGLSSLQELQRGDFWIEPPYSEEDALRLIRRAATVGPQRFEWQNRDRNGQVFFEDVMLSNVILDDVERVMAVSLDITARKLAEEVLQRQAEELRIRNAELERFNLAMVGRELEMVRLKREVNALASALGGPARYDLAAVDGAPAAPPAGAPK